MKIIQINTFPYKSTGAIMMNLHGILTENGYDSYVAWGRGRDAENDHEIAFGDELGVKLHGAYTRITDRTGFASKAATARLIKGLDEIKPDIIHLHNIHGYYVNIEMLFEYINSHEIPLVWTLHDCWSFTGHCAWFDACGCEKWKTGCYCCPQKKTYPASLLADASEWNYRKKRELFNGVENAVIVTPSQWLKGLAEESFLNGYPIKLIYNGIDLKTFCLQDEAEKIKNKFGLDNRPLILGAASEWTERKGLRDIITLAERMSKLQFAAVGLTEKQIAALPKNVKGIKRTASVREMAQLYSAADIFFNPTYEDNFPTTNVEALACGTPVVTYDTGGSPEVFANCTPEQRNYAGRTVNKLAPTVGDLAAAERCIEDVLSVAEKNGKEKISAYCRQAAQYYDKDRRLRDYINIYESMPAPESK